MHYKNEFKVLDNRKMAKHVKHINLKLFFTYSRKENLGKVVRERGKTFVSLFSLLRLECEYGSYDVGV